MGLESRTLHACFVFEGLLQVGTSLPPGILSLCSFLPFRSSSISPSIDIVDPKASSKFQETNLEKQGSFCRRFEDGLKQSSSSQTPDAMLFEQSARIKVDRRTAVQITSEMAAVTV